MKGKNKVIEIKPYQSCPICGNISYHRDDCYIEQLLNNNIVQNTKALKTRLGEEINFTRDGYNIMCEIVDEFFKDFYEKEKQ